MEDIIIDNKIIGLNTKTFICAEVGTTCNGDLSTAKKMIDVAVEAEIDGLKFQVLDPEKDFSDTEMIYSYKTYSGATKSEKMIQMLKRYTFTFEEWKEIKTYGDSKGVTIFATPSHLEAVELMEELNMPAYKICSWNMNFFPLIREIAQTKKPVFIDSGPVNGFEMMRAINVIKKEDNNKIVLLYCYHTNVINEINLNTINYLRNTYNTLVGYSSGGQNEEIDFISLAYKPAIIEARLTLSRRDEGHHHSISMEPDEISKYVKKIRAYENTIGKIYLSQTSEERESKEKYFRSIFFEKDLIKGTLITENDISCKRPAGKGIDPFRYDEVIGRRVVKDVKRNEPVTWECI